MVARLSYNVILRCRHHAGGDTAGSPPNGFNADHAWSCDASDLHPQTAAKGQACHPKVEASVGPRAVVNPHITFRRAVIF